MIKPSTFSIVALDPATGELGVATQSKFLAVGSVVPWARAKVGAIATQSWANTSYGPKGLDLLEQGLSPQEVLDRLLEEDPDREFRQVGIVDFQGRSATFTGSECFPWAGGRNGPYYACQGNILVSEDTVIAMEQTFNETGGELADRLIAALQAGQKAGGDSRGQQSAALLVVKDKGGYGGFNDIYIDLRVDDHSSPIDELARLLRLHKLYFPRENEELLEIDDNILSEISSALSSLGYLEDSNQDKESIMKAFEKFAMKENLEERLREDNKIYRIVLDFLAEKASNR
ncbi:protein of unknown function DUF1028 [Thermobaculum terrenum ATCC BAA-798]|uniref:Putative peptidoglycan binding domain-containing protein n=1 Tax=Thermobaculum terrenum (strain ATCC BAA-798 / CCMEE 7001 / YNP1) TaxID=525904 RepID=D1CFB5_THET1|nr:DUF1028 domain-containing protein [Thermobaculum terrenum]ACZ41621.1 protein of unknown function DUF1028 [Thermobaculum terrenum ATCC BAA-798]